METQDLLIFLEKFEEFFLDLQQKFSDDKDHRWFQNYIFMSENIKDKVFNYLNQIIDELNKIQEKYSEIYAAKDMKYHTDTAMKYCNTIKDRLRELIHLYREQEEYSKIRLQWEITFTPLIRNIKNLRGRLLIIKRILNN